MDQPLNTHIPQPGTPAPDFTLPSTEEHPISLADYRGQRNVVLLFYPQAFSPVCSLQLPAYQARKGDFDDHDAQILAVSTDHKWAVAAFAQQLGLEYPLLADYTREVARAYGVLRAEGYTNRAVFVIDKQGIVRFSVANNPGTQPDQREVLAALQSLT